ncbi:hypothetical protein M9Y10_016651 [Tritrichomonas musculus]|uniref:Uncharacterized protein n=1 Tax=Tritrichomonas musculus TaxID=1915356 RepID=A0ABR2HYE7_9EUKA
MSITSATDIQEVQATEQQVNNKYSTMTIAELRKEREVQVNELAFEEVALIDEAINNLHLDNTEKVISEETQKLSEVIDVLFKRYDSSVNMVKEKYDKNEDKYRTQSMENIERMKERHNQKLAELETKKSQRLQRAEERRSVKDQELKEKAKNLARQGEIDEAIQYRTESEIMKELEIQARKKDIDCRFERMMNNLNTKQENNMRIIEDSFSSTLDRIQTEKEEELKTTNQALKININYALQKAIYSGTRNVKRDKRVDFVQRMNGFVQSKIEGEKEF